MNSNMPMPAVVSRAVDQQQGLNFEVRAYRALTPQEIAMAVDHWRRTNRKRVKRGDTIVIITTHGSHP